MTNFIEIGGLIKKGLGHSVVERFSKNIDVILVMQMEGLLIYLISTIWRCQRSRNTYHDSEGKKVIAFLTNYIIS